MATRIKIRRGTSSEWTSANPVLDLGELGLETDTKKLKAGTGSTAWNSLEYLTKNISEIESEIAAADAVVQSYSIQRSNHTGTQSVNTITGLASVATSGSKSDVGLGNVDNTSDVDKPISSATQSAIDLKYDKTNPSGYVNAASAAAAAPVQSVAGKTGAVQLNITDLNDTAISNPLVDQVLRYNGAKWQNGSNAVVNPGPSVTFYLTRSASPVVGYDYISKTPDNAAQIDEVTPLIKDTPTLMGSYISDSTINKTSIDAGIWEFNFWTYVNTQSFGLTVNVYKRTTDGTETLLFSADNTIVNWSTSQMATITTVQQPFNCDASDVLVIKIYGLAVNNNLTAHLIHSGTSEYSHFHTPLSIGHNDIAGLQGGTTNQFYHLTSSEYTGTGTGNFVRSTSPTITSPTGLVKADVGLSNVPNVDTTVASNITQDSTHRFVSDTQISTWDGKQNALGFTPANLNASNTFSGKQIMTPTATTPGLNVGSINGDPSAPTDGDLWYNTTAQEFKFRENGINIPLRTLINVRTITSGTTYTPSAGTSYIYATLIGGGGGGGGCPVGSGTTQTLAGAGGAGATMHIFTALTGAASYTCAIGAAGTAGATTPTAGGAGGVTSLTIGATTYTVNGGSGGALGPAAATTITSILGGAGAALPSGGLINLGGQSGTNGLRLSGTVAATSKGGDTIYGTGGLPLTAAGNGNTGTGYGSGGSGGWSGNVATARTGGAGAPGVIVIFEYC